MIHAIRAAAFVVCAAIAIVVCSCSAEAHPPVGRGGPRLAPRARQSRALRDAERALDLAERAVRNARRGR